MALILGGALVDGTVAINALCAILYGNPSVSVKDTPKSTLHPFLSPKVGISVCNWRISHLYCDVRNRIH
jgi:hypothetical protein